MTTVPPFESCSVHLFAGLAATAGGGVMLGSGGTTGAGAAAISINAQGNPSNNFPNIIPPWIYSGRDGAVPLTCRLTGVQVPANIVGHTGRNEAVDRAAIARDFLDQLGGDRLQRDVGHQEDGFDVVVQLLVH